MAADHPEGHLNLYFNSTDEARDAVVKYGDRRDVTVHVPNLNRLGDAAWLIEEMLPQLKRRIWVLKPSYMLKRLASLDTDLWYLYEKGVDKVLVCLATAIGYYDLILTPPSAPKLYDDAPLPDMDLAGGNPPVAVLLQEVQALGDNDADSKAATVALLRGLLGAGNGTVLIEELRQALTTMDAVFSRIASLAAWTTKFQACRDIALAGHLMIQALGVLELPRDPMPLASESMAARRSRLQRIELPMWHFKEAIEDVCYTWVAFQGQPGLQDLQMDLPGHANAPILLNFLQDYAHGVDLNDPKVLEDERERLYNTIQEGDDFGEEVASDAEGDEEHSSAWRRLGGD